MKTNINIKANNQVFSYLAEYIIDPEYISHHNVRYHTYGNDIWLLNSNSTHYKCVNDFISIHNDEFNDSQIPEGIDYNTIKIYIPSHSIDTYYKNHTYALTLNTWIQGHKITLGTYMFKKSDAMCNITGMVKHNGNEYYECVEFKVIDPYKLTYSDEWKEFREVVCNEIPGTNSTGSILYFTLDVLTEKDGNYILDENFITGCNHFNMVKPYTEFLDLDLKFDIDKWILRLNMNSEYNGSLLEYINETYGLEHITKENIKYEVVLKNKDTIVLGPEYNNVLDNEVYVTLKDINECTSIRSGMKDAFSSWDNYSEGWFMVGSLSIFDPMINDDAITIVSNSVPLTKDIFKYFVSGHTTEKIIDVNDMEIINYNVVNKIVNEVVQIERPNESSKSNIIQPVFFRVKETEYLTLHPIVTENVCINLDDYKSKVESFILQIEGCKFKQLGSNQYGEVFKVTGNTLPCEKEAGIYYILNENNELVTTGKYKYIM